MDSEYSSQCLKDHFLIAMPELSEGIFAHSLTYICEHTEHGAMGIVVNHPLELLLDEILDQLHISHGRSTEGQQVMAGGPVQVDRGFILHRGDKAKW
jgi:putative transcriptional regulator